MIIFHLRNEREKPLTSATELRTLIPHVAALVSFSWPHLESHSQPRVLRTFQAPRSSYKRETLYWIVNNRDAFIV